MENPFADYGAIVYGDRFIGREAEIRAVRNRVFGKTYGNLAIQGLPRMGKSSLAWKAIFEYEPETAQNKTLRLFIEVGEIRSAEAFFDTMVESLRLMDLGNDVFSTHFEAIAAAKEGIEKRRGIKDLFSSLKKQGFRLIYVFDEFDSVRNYFEVQDFQFLRTLTYNPNIKICVVTISRRTLSEIEAKSGGGSNFYHTFSDVYLGMYSEEDLNLYWEKFFNSRVPINEQGKQQIYAFAGEHPFLLDLFNYHLYNNLSEDLNLAIAVTKEKLKLTIWNSYKAILDLLEEENLTAKLLQMVVGPVYDITSVDAEKIERYGLVRKQDGGYKAFSEDFDGYLKRTKREIPIWNLWTETEIKLRQIVRLWLIERYGEDWAAKFRKLQNKETFVAGLEAMQERERRSFPETYSQNLLDFTYPADLFDKFMRVEWQWFKPILGKEANEWKLKFDVLAKVRNPLAHNKENILNEFERNEAKAYCEEIITKINQWTQKK